MFDKLDDLLVRFEELLNELGEPGVTDDPAHFPRADHPVHLSEARPHHVVRLPGLQNDAFQGDTPEQAVVVIENVALPVAVQ